MKGRAKVSCPATWPSSLNGMSGSGKKKKVICSGLICFKCSCCSEEVFPSMLEDGGQLELTHGFVCLHYLFLYRRQVGNLRTGDCHDCDLRDWSGKRC